MRVPTSQVLGSDFEPRETRNYDLDDTELYSGPTQWRLDRDAVFLWAKKRLTWGQCWPIPIDLLTENIYCDKCSYPSPQATHVSYFRDLFCPKHYREWKRQQRKPRSRRRVERAQWIEWLDREWWCCWKDIKTPEQYLWEDD